MTYPAPMSDESSLQRHHAPHGICFGCGPANARGLKIDSYVQGDEVVCDFTPEEHHQAFPGILNGGIIGTLLDCHSNWTAAWAIMVGRGASEASCTVTASFHVKLRRPTPLGPVRLVARVSELSDPKCVVDAELIAGGKVCATCRGVFVAVTEGHPAWHRWG